MFEIWVANDKSLGIKNDLIRGTKIFLKVIKEKMLTENYFSHVIW